jgi:hypothetical protein
MRGGAVLTSLYLPPNGPKYIGAHSFLLLSCMPNQIFFLVWASFRGAEVRVPWQGLPFGPDAMHPASVPYHAAKKNKQ